MVRLTSIFGFIGVVFTLFGLSSCTLDNELYQVHFSREVEDAPKIASLLMGRGILGEGGVLRVYWFTQDGQKAELNDQPLPDHGVTLALWSWQKTQGYYLEPDRVRDGIKKLAEDHPPDSLLLPGALGPFLVDLYHATDE